MSGADLSGDDRTFRVNFAGDGVGKLKENVKEELIKLMGDHCDDTLVDYVVVLLRNGKRKDEVLRDLNVFLGVDTVPFVSWLWDHLSSNFHLYDERKVPFHDHLAQARFSMNKIFGRHDSQLHQMSGRKHTDLEFEKQEDTYSCRSVGPPSRLLQLAVRDAMSTVQNPSLRTLPAPRPLRSMASSSTDSFLADKSQMTRLSYSVEEAGEDVQKVRCSGNVFGAQGHVMDSIETINLSSILRNEVLVEEEFDDIFQIPGLDDLECFERIKYDGELTEGNTGLDAETGTLNNEGYSCTGSRRFMSDSSFIENKNPFKLKYNVSKDSNGVKQARIQDQEPHATAEGKEPQKIVNISVDVNTWKPSQLQSSWNLSVGDSPSNGEKGNLRTGVSNVQCHNTAIFETHNAAAVAVADAEKEFQKTIPSTPGC